DLARLGMTSPVSVSRVVRPSKKRAMAEDDEASSEVSGLSVAMSPGWVETKRAPAWPGGKGTVSASSGRGTTVAWRGGAGGGEEAAGSVQASSEARRRLGIVRGIRMLGATWRTISASAKAI